MGSITSLAAVCTTRSRIVGIPRGRSPPPGLGIITRRTGIGRYVFSRSSLCKAVSQSSRPSASDLPSNVTPSTPGAAPLSSASSHAWSKMLSRQTLSLKLVKPAVRLSLRLEVQLPLQRPDAFGCLRRLFAASEARAAGSRRCFCSLGDHGACTLNDRTRAKRSRHAVATERPGSPRRWWPSAVDGTRSDAACGPEALG